MTAEVAVLNRSAVALAADSAVSVESVSRGHIVTKVFNTANKLFTLSKYEPVGIMVYNTMTLGGVPWETVIKEHRRALGRTKFNTLGEYADNFFSFLKGNRKLFSEDDQRDVAQTLLFRAFAGIFYGCKTGDGIKGILKKQLSDLYNREKVAHFTDEFIQELKSDYRDVIWRVAELVADPIEIVSLKDLCVDVGALILTRKEPLGGYSGVVFAGFGENQVYPSMHQYIVDAILKDEVKYSSSEEWHITYNQRSHVIPFAERDTVKTILEGVSPTYGRRFYEEALKMLSGMPEVIINSISELDADQKSIYINSAAGTAVNAFRDLSMKMNEHRRKLYGDPINQAISLMPISELAVVAEVFVNLSQIRQRMSLETETVGGPIDVAVISKGDGFVWIKRKHYFDKEINPFFLEKYLAKS